MEDNVSVMTTMTDCGTHQTKRSSMRTTLPLSLKSLLLSSVLIAAATTSFAETIEGSLLRNHPATLPGGTVSLHPDSAARLVFSRDAIAAMNANNMGFESISPASIAITRDARNKYVDISLDVPVASLTADLTMTSDKLQDAAFHIHGISTRGGFRLTSTDDGFMSSGGSVAITNLRVDLKGSSIYGDMVGANGVSQEAMALWTFTGSSQPGHVFEVLGETCTLAVPVTCKSVLSAENNFTGLQFEAASFDAFSQALGLTQDGKDVLRHVGNIGMLVTSVPEASALVQMGLGLAGLITLVTRRQYRLGASRHPH